MVGRTVGSFFKAAVLVFTVLCLPVILHAEVEDVKTLIKKLDSEDVRVRQEAAEALGETKDPSAIRPLTKALKKDEYWDVREAAATALGEIGDEAAVKNLLNALEKDENGNVQGAAAAALGEIGAEKAVDPLIEALDYKSSEARKEAAKALGKIKDTSAIEPLMETLRDDDPRVRQNTAYALGELAITFSETKLRGSDSTVVVMNEQTRAIKKLDDALSSEEMDIIAGAYSYYIKKGEEQSLELLEKAIYIYGNEDMAADYLNSGNQRLEQAALYWAEAHSETLPTDGKKGPGWGEYNE